MEGRMSGKKGNEKSLNYLEESLKSCGLPTKTDEFKIKRANPGPGMEEGSETTKNLYCWIEGSTDEIVVIGAHFDHIGYGPKYSRSRKIEIHNGADDNASGSAAVLEIAKAMSGLKPKRTILFQFYSGEEMGLLGSRHYCANPSFPLAKPDIKKHVAMVNLDMIGHLEEDNAKVSFLDSSVDLASAVFELASKYKFAHGVTGHGSGGSDHASFYNNKIPVAFIHTGLHRYYHTPEDDLETLNIDGILKISRYAMDLVWKLANEAKPEFNKSSFTEIPYDEDHGQVKF
jgi:Zn-dependent M28 family amino/carboxypeptidase